jgi:dipeptidyl-peptidase-4
MPSTAQNSKLAQLVLIAAVAISPSGLAARQTPQTAAPQAPARPFTVDRIYSEPSLSGRLTSGIAWSPDGKQLGFFRNIPPSLKESRTELWVMDVASGKSRLLVSSDKLDSVLPTQPGRPTQATGLGRRAPAQYQWAPDGTALLFQGPNSLAWFDLKTQTSRALVSGRQEIADPKISPDGRCISFVREHNLWLVDVVDGKERALTQGGTEEIRKGELDWVYPEELDLLTAYWWAPDSSAIAFLEMDERKVAKYPLVDFASPTGEAEEERYPPAGGANPMVRVFVAPVSGGEAHAMDTGKEADIYIARVNWLPDSKHLAIQRLNRPQTVLDLLFADVSSGETRAILTEKDQYWINISDDLHFFKDGKRFLWSSERSGCRHLYSYDIGGKQLTQVTKGDWEVTSIAGVDEPKRVIYLSATEKSPLERHLYRVALDGSGLTRITKANGSHGIHFSPDAASFVDTYSNSMNPPMQSLFRADGSLIAVINENKVPDLANYNLQPVEFLSVRAHDGAQLNAMMIKPPDFNPARKYPVIVFTYGGPHAQVVLNAWGGSNFLWHQLMAKKGYIIFALDNRGSAGRGHLFEIPLHLRLGAQELSDQHDGARYLKSLPFVDGNRIGIWGGSYGGHMTLHAMFEDSEDFKVGFAHAPVTDWHYYDSIYTERYLGLLPQNEKGYEESSPVKYAAQLKGKLLIAHGTGDDNVHFANTLSLIDELIKAGKYVEVLPFPGRGHGVSDPPARRILMNRVMQFFLDNL